MLSFHKETGESQMARMGLNMKIVDEVLRLHRLGLKKRKIARALGIHRDTVTKYLELSEAAVVPVDGGALAEQRLSFTSAPPLQPPEWHETLNWQKVRDDYQQGVPLNILHAELFASNHAPVTYPAFWKMLQKKAPTLKTTMVKVFAPGSRIEIDYCDGIHLTHPITGEKIETEFFVGVLCCSRYTFAEFTLSQKSGDFLNSHVRMFNFFGGVSQIVTPDNLKSAVTKAHRYDPVINPAYTKLATHYNFAVEPARVRRPQDKAVVERTIQIFQKWFFMVVRNRVFTSLIELNSCLREHLVLFNQKIHRVFKRSRLEMFESERGHLVQLPKDAYLVQTHHRAFLSRDCHLSFDSSFYSAPYHLRGLTLDVWATENSVEIYHDGTRVAFHVRSKSHGKFVTENTHYPEAQQAYLEEDVIKMKSWSQAIGAHTSTLIHELLSGAYPLKHLRRAQGILALSQKHSKPLLEFACENANRFNQKTIRYIERVMKQNQSNFRRIETGGEPIARGFNPYLRGVDDPVH
jgi:transposase